MDAFFDCRDGYCSEAQISRRRSGAISIDLGDLFLLIDAHGVARLSRLHGRHAYVSRTVAMCPYLGQPREELVIVKALCGCRGKQTWKTAQNIVHDCALQGRCLPSYRCARAATQERVTAGEWAQPCASCEFFPGNGGQGTGDEGRGNESPPAAPL